MIAQQDIDERTIAEDTHVERSQDHEQISILHLECEALRKQLADEKANFEAEKAKNDEENSNLKSQVSRLKAMMVKANEGISQQKKKALD
ncbi:MAG: hypothetical protein EZS28_012506 [Streblomastix strix]|uniref:Uncharacterized protein n=1 Tax=Streblomastix strix TaxID=222440 RepID=A0A5J4WAP4_9EUKA|nr:MAG: hypothetical protein EZS28_012506 [Streblomastix strix]